MGFLEVPKSKHQHPCASSGKNSPEAAPVLEFRKKMTDLSSVGTRARLLAARRPKARSVRSGWRQWPRMFRLRFFKRQMPMAEWLPYSRTANVDVPPPATDMLRTGDNARLRRVQYFGVQHSPDPPSSE